MSFLLLELAPGDYFDEMRLSPQLGPEALEALRSKHGLDRPLLTRYFEWLASAVRGDWGLSFANNLPVAPLLVSRASNTLLLTVTATLIAWLVAIPAGLLWAVRPGKAWDRLWGLGTATLIGFPEVLLALLFLLVALRTGGFPLGGMTSVDSAQESDWARVTDLVRHMVLPVTVLVLARIGVLVRHVRASVSEVLQETFVRAVRARGVSRGRVMFRHVLLPAANPLVSLMGLSVASLLSGSLLVEVVMGWPGLGPLLLEAVLARDFFVVVGAVMCSALLLVVGSLLADALLHLSDPRISVS